METWISRTLERGVCLSSPQTFSQWRKLPTPAAHGQTGRIFSTEPLTVWGGPGGPGDAGQGRFP